MWLRCVEEYGNILHSLNGDVVCLLRNICTEHNLFGSSLQFYGSLVWFLSFVNVSHPDVFIYTCIVQRISQTQLFLLHKMLF